jgi:hypothetical protein
MRTVLLVEKAMPWPFGVSAREIDYRKSVFSPAMPELLAKEL